MPKNRSKQRKTAKNSENQCVRYILLASNDHFSAPRVPKWAPRCLLSPQEPTIYSYSTSTKYEVSTYPGTHNIEKKKSKEHWEARISSV